MSNLLTYHNKSYIIYTGGIMKLINKLKSYLPTPLPKGLTEFNIWADNIIELSGKYADIDSMKWTLCNIVLSLPTTCNSKPKNHFVKVLHKAAANQVVSYAINEIKDNQKRMAEEQAKKQEVTASDKTTSGEETKT